MTLQKTMVFFTGTSAVGKTTLVSKLAEHYRELATIVPMSARIEREQLGNPSWEDLESNIVLSIKHQIFIEHSYTQRLLSFAESLSTGVGNDILLFERSPLDVAGYSFAFGCPVFLYDTQRDRWINAIVPTLRSSGIRVLLFHVVMNKCMPYAIEEGRPPMHIRDTCAHYLESSFDTLLSLKKESVVFEISADNPDPLEFVVEKIEQCY